MRSSKANGKYRSAYRVTCEGGILPGTQEKNNSPEDPSLDSCPELESDGDEATQEN